MRSFTLLLSFFFLEHLITCSDVSLDYLDYCYLILLKVVLLLFLMVKSKPGVTKALNFRPLRQLVTIKPGGSLC